LDCAKHKYNKISPKFTTGSSKNLGHNSRIIINPLIKLLQNPDHIEELRMKLEMLRGFEFEAYNVK